MRAAVQIAGAYGGGGGGSGGGGAYVIGEQTMLRGVQPMLAGAT